jgi:chorismate mutase
MMGMADSVVLKAGREGAGKSRKSGRWQFGARSPLDENAAGGKLAALRGRIGKADRRLAMLLAQRCAMAREVAAEKSRLGRPVTDRARELAVLRNAEAHARSLGLDQGIMRRVFREIIRLAKACEHEFLSGRRG